MVQKLPTLRAGEGLGLCRGGNEEEWTHENILEKDMAMHHHTPYVC